MPRNQISPYPAREGAIRRCKVYLLLITGSLAEARKSVDSRYPGCTCAVLDKRELREGGMRGQIKAFRKLKGEAIVFFVHSLDELQEPSLALLSSFLHSCNRTIFADSKGAMREYGRFAKWWLTPVLALNAVCDLLTFVLSRGILSFFAHVFRLPIFPMGQLPDFDVAYLYPYPLDHAVAGGAMSHVQGILSGLESFGLKCEIFSGRTFSPGHFPNHSVPKKRVRFLFRESFMLSYNLRFVKEVQKILRGRRPGIFYQRHGRFVVAGAILSRICEVPLVLEYNSSELRMADYGDPVRFRGWLELCENISLSQANLILVVSEALRQELLDRNISNEKILVLPNAVDPEVFHPDCGGREMREQLGFQQGDIVAGFVGTFSYWHGIEVLKSAITRILETDTTLDKSVQVKFLLIGDGPLCAEMCLQLKDVSKGRVSFTGIVPHHKIPAYLDAADILLSPHIPMPDGRPFFGSPTKLFEYMAMSKAIVASNLEQLAKVLDHGRSAWMVTPGDPVELASAILLLARDAELRKRLGQNARMDVMADHSWRQNVAKLMARIQQRDPAPSLAVART